MKLALFDLDHTLLNTDSDYSWGEFLVNEGLVDPIRHRQMNDQFYEDYKAGQLDPIAYNGATDTNLNGQVITDFNNLANALQATGQTLAAARERVAMAPLLTGDAAHSNHEAIWVLIAAVPADQLQASGNPTLRTLSAGRTGFSVPMAVTANHGSAATAFIWYRSQVSPAHLRCPTRVEKSWRQRPRPSLTTSAPSTSRPR